MKAAVLTEWNHVEMQEIGIPEIGDEEMLVKVTYAGICGSDVTIYTGRHPSAKAPVVMGHEFVGTVVKMNTKFPTDIRVGDRIVPQPLISCGHCEACSEGNWHVCRTLKLLGIHTNGGFEQYVRVPVEKAVKVDNIVSDRIATLTEPFAVGFHVHQRAGTRCGDRVLIIGAGPIGLIVGIVAKVCGAGEIVFSEINPDRIAQARSFGFDKVIDPSSDDTKAKVAEYTNGEGFDVVFEVSGSQPGIRFATEACKIRGTIVPVGFPKKVPEFDVMAVIFKELQLVGSRVYTMNDFRKTVAMLKNIVQDQSYDLEKLVSDVYSLDNFEEALQLMISGQNLGKILIEMEGD